MTFLTEENSRLNQQLSILTADSNALAAANMRITNLENEIQSLTTDNQNQSSQLVQYQAEQ